MDDITRKIKKRRRKKWMATNTTINLVGIVIAIAF
jgi:hypothetical protein